MSRMAMLSGPEDQRKIREFTGDPPTKGGWVILPNPLPPPRIKQKMLYLDLTPDADAEDIKAAYRRLSKAYHPDTTSLPLDLAAEMFVRLKEAYDVLSSQEQRRLYDWQLAQKLVPMQDGRAIYTSEYGGKTMADDGTRLAEAPEDSDFVPSPVDTLRGRKLEMDFQSQAALLFDGFAIVVAILTVVFVIFIKQK